VKSRHGPATVRGIETCGLEQARSRPLGRPGKASDAASSQETPFVGSPCTPRGRGMGTARSLVTAAVPRSAPRSRKDGDSCFQARHAESVALGCFAL
jgi:hypothetical protein